MKTGKIAALLALAASMVVATGVSAQDYPDKPITLIVPFAAGGPTDVIARVIAKGMQEQLQTSIVVENRSGAAGRLGVELLKKAKPDGYTIGMATASTQGVAPNLYTKLEYDPLQDFKAVGQVVTAPGVLITNKNALPDCTMASFLTLLRVDPGRYAFGSSGQGGLSHMSGEQFLVATGLQMLHVPYRGLGPAMNDLYSGQITALFDNVSTAIPHIQSGRICALAVQARERLVSLPDVPTYAELGLAQLNDPTWYGILAPRDTPESIVVALNRALNAALQTDDIRATFERLGVTPSPVASDAFTRVQEREVAKWRDIVAKAGMKKLDE